MRFAEELEKLKDIGNQNENGLGASSSTNLGNKLSSSSATLTENEKYAKALLIAVREEIYKKGYKSANKLRLPPPGEDEKKWKAKEHKRLFKANDEVNSIRAEIPSGLGTKSYFFALQKALRAKGHNCNDLALAGICILDNANIKDVHQLNFDDFDHAVVLIGDIPKKGLHPKMEDWPSHLAICDPWGNIACSAKEFIPRVMEKMEKWESRGKQVLDSEKEAFRSPIYTEIEKDLRGKYEILVINTKPPGADEHGRTPLMHAAQNGKTEKLVDLIEAGVDLNAVDRNGTTALMFSVMANNIQRVDVLIRAGANTRAKRHTDAATALKFAARNCNIEMMKLLIESGTDKDDQMNSLETLLERSPNSEAAIKAAAAMLDAGVDGIDALLYFSNKSTMRLRAFINATRKKCMKYLLEAGADGAGAMLRLAQKGATSPLKRLISAGADKIRNAQGETALMQALKMTASDHEGVSETGLGILEALLKAGADVTIRDNEGKTAKERATELAVNSGNKKALLAIEAAAPKNASSSKFKR